MINEFPKWKYKGDGDGVQSRIVDSRHEEDALGEGWGDTPWGAKGETPEPAVTVGMSLQDAQRGAVMTARAPAAFAEYPKWVTPPGGEPVLIKGRAEEAAAMGGASDEGNAGGTESGDLDDAGQGELAVEDLGLPGPPRRGRPRAASDVASASDSTSGQ